jgi:HK97 family phage portal protein
MVRPSGALEVPGGFTEQAKANLRASVERVNSGAKATARLMLLEDGVKFNPFALNNSEAQLLESRGFSVQEIARFLGVSPTKLGDLGRATWSNIESENRSFVENTLMPVLCGRDQETNRKLIRRTMRGKLYAESLADARLRGNTAERYASYQVGIQSGFLLRSEARRLENLAWVEGMDKPLVPVAVAQPDTPPAAAAGTTQEPPADANPVA